MRKFSLCLALLAVLLQATARERSLDEKKNLAISVLQKSFNRSAQKTSSVETMIVLQESQTFTIIGYTSGGFAVISNDDSNAPILGYSLTGNIDNAPPLCNTYLTPISSKGENKFGETPQTEKGEYITSISFFLSNSVDLCLSQLLYYGYQQIEGNHILQIF